MRVAIAQDLYSIIVNINVCTDFELLKVKVPLIFLGMVGFSARRDGRYVLEGLEEIRSHPRLDCEPPGA